MKWIVTTPDGKQRNIESDMPPVIERDGCLTFSAVSGELRAAVASGQWHSVELAQADVFGDATKAVS